MEWDKQLFRSPQRPDREADYHARTPNDSSPSLRARLPTVANTAFSSSQTPGNTSGRRQKTFSFPSTQENETLQEQIRQLKLTITRLKEEKMKLQTRIGKLETDMKRLYKNIDLNSSRELSSIEVISLNEQSPSRPRSKQPLKQNTDLYDREDLHQETSAYRLSEVIALEASIKDIKRLIEQNTQGNKEVFSKSIQIVSLKLDELLLTVKTGTNPSAKSSPTPPLIPKSPLSTATTSDDRGSPLTNPVLASRRFVQSPRKSSIVFKPRDSMVHVLQSQSQRPSPSMRRTLSKTETRVEKYSTLVAFLIDKKSKLNSINLDTLSWDEFAAWVEKQPEEEHENIVRELFYMMKSYRKVVDISTQLSFSSTAEEVIGRFCASVKEILVSELVHFYTITRPGELTLFANDGGFQKSIPKGQGIIGYVAESATMMNLSNPQSSGYFDSDFDKPESLTLSCILAIPVIDRENRVFGVAVAYNKVTGFFVKEDEVVMESLVNQASNSIQQFQLLIRSNWEQQKTKSLLEVIKATNNEKYSLDDMIAKIVEVTYSALRVENVSFHLVDRITNRLVARTDSKNRPGMRRKSGDEETGIAGIVAKTGRPLSITNGEHDSRCVKLSQEIGIKIKTLLCVPICDSNERTIAVIQVINKEQGCFTESDEDILSAFMVEISSVVQRKSLETAYENLAGSENDSTTITSLKDLIDEYSTFKIALTDPTAASRPSARTARGSHQLTEGLKDWNLDHFAFTGDEMIEMIVSGFHALDQIDLHHIDEQVLRTFVRTVHSNYQQNPYHNFVHAFSVFHCAFMILTTTDLPEYLTHLDILALLIAALCHDLDHPGTNNAFQINSQSTLAIVYNDQSVLENHHASLTFRILADPSCNILATLDPTERNDVRRSIISAILATDMSHHADLTTRLSVHQGRFHRDHKQDRDFLLTIVLHSSDLCNPVLPTHLAHRWASCVLLEFNQQADKEKELRLPVASFMENGDEISKAKLNLNFIKYVVNPLWSRLVEIFPSLRCCLEQLETNAASWERIVNQGE